MSDVGITSIWISTSRQKRLARGDRGANSDRRSFEQLSAENTASGSPAGARSDRTRYRRARRCRAASSFTWPFATSPRVPACVRRGPTLHLQHRAGGRHWSLSDGRALPAAVAAIIINNKSVEPANDGLFPDLLAQTWRMK